VTHVQSPRVRRLPRVLSAALLALAGSTLLAGCEAILIGGAVIGTGMVATDRRTTGIQLEDQNIESKAARRARDLSTLGRINAHSYNRTVLLTGEVPNEADKAAIEKAVAGVENVRGVVNELAVMDKASMSTRSSDSLLEAKVKASLVDSKDLQANAFRVVAERGTVYLMGRVTEREAAGATAVARAVPGVQRVVRVLELMSEEELAALGKAPAPAPAQPAPPK
jgi:osmotically-inducible protein OsmY